MGADDDEQVLLLPKPARLVARHVLDLGDEALVRRGRGEGPGEPGAIAGLAAVEDGQGPDRRRRAGRERVVAGQPGDAGFEAGEIAADPARLLGRHRAAQGLDLAALLEAERVGREKGARGHGRFHTLSPLPLFAGEEGPAAKRWEVRVLLSPVYRPSPPTLRDGPLLSREERERDWSDECDLDDPFVASPSCSRSVGSIWRPGQASAAGTSIATRMWSPARLIRPATARTRRICSAASAGPRRGRC